MVRELELVLQLQAYEQGHAVRKASHRRTVLQPHARVLTTLAMAGEDTTIHACLWGALGQPPEICIVPDPRYRADQYGLFQWLAHHMETYIADCRREGTFPQLWVSSGATAGHLDILADRLRYNRHDAQVRRLGVLLSYFTERIPIAGQQALLVATDVLRQYYATGQQAGEDEHLGALLAWIDRPVGVNIVDAVNRAEQLPMGCKTDPVFDQEILIPLVTAYNTARKEKAAPPALRHRAVQIEDALAPVGFIIYAATQRAARHLATQRLPELSSLSALKQQEVEAFESFMISREQGFPLALRDSPKAATFKYTEREQAQENVEAAQVCEDRVARVGAVISGRAASGRVANPQRIRLGTRQFEYRFDLVSNQRSLRLRRGDDLHGADDPRLRVTVIDIHRQGPVTRVSLVLIAGMRAVGLPTAGAYLEMIPGVPDWSRIWRSRVQLRDRLTQQPWTHTANTLPPAIPQASPSPDPLQNIRNLRNHP